MRVTLWITTAIHLDTPICMPDHHALCCSNSIESTTSPKTSPGLVYLQSHVFGENMAPSRSTPRMMQVTEAAFQAKVSLKEQATDPKSHTSVRTLILFPSCPVACNSLW